MANYQLLKADIDAKVYQNGEQEITGENLNAVLNAMVTTLGEEYQFAGVATIDTNPDNPDAKVFYIANGKGTYTNFGGIEVTEDEVVVLYWDTEWHKVATGIASQAKLTELNEKVDALALGAFYGYFPDSSSLPVDVTTPGYAYVGLDNPYKIWNFNGKSWSDSGTSIDMNDADEEDITRNADGKLQFKDRTYGDGMGYAILRKDKTFAGQVTKANAIYEIRYDFDLGNTTVTIPANCILYLNGGKFSNGTIAGNRTKIFSGIYQIFDNVILSGSWNIENCYCEWFGAHGDNINDDTLAIQAAINTNIPVKFLNRIYKISDSIIVESTAGVYTTDGYNGKTITGCASSKFIITNNKPLFIVRGFGNSINEINLSYSTELHGTYNAAMLELQSLDANQGKISCYNTFERIKCCSNVNLPGGTGYSGIGIRLVSNGSNATYQNRFINCYIADLNKGIVIDNESTMGINNNLFIVDISNCDYLVKGNPNASVFIGSWQAGFKLSNEDNVCIDLAGSENSFLSFTYDVGTWETGSRMAPYLYLRGSSVNNNFSQHCDWKSIKGHIVGNIITPTMIPAYNDYPIAYNTRSAVQGSGGLPLTFAPYDNSLRNSGIAINMVTENIGYEYASITLYPTRDDNNIPTDIKALSGKAVGKSFELKVLGTSKIKFQITLPANSWIDGLQLYFTNRRPAFNALKVNQYSTGFDSIPVYTEEIDISDWVFTYVRSINLAPRYFDLPYRYIEIELDYALEAPQNVGFAYISAICNNEVSGPILEE